MAYQHVPIRWWGSAEKSVRLACVVPDAERITARRPPPPLEAEDHATTSPYMWRRNNHYLNDTDPSCIGWRMSWNGSLEVERGTDSEGVYQCVVRTAGGLVLGYPTRLKYAYINSTFSSYPENMTVRAGQPAVLRCEVGSGPPAALHWQRDSRPLTYNNRYLALENQLLILDVQKEDEGFYRCEATNTVENKTLIIPAGRLAVVSGGDVAVGFLPLHYEAEVATPRGSSLVLPCPLTGWPKPKIIWEVTPPGGRRRELESVDEVLMLQSVQLDDEGLYTCSIEGNSDFTKSFSVSVWERAAVALPPAGKRTHLASTVRFNCTPAGRPAPTRRWYKDAEPLHLAGRIEELPSADGARTELLIRSVTSDDAGVYQCFVSGGGGGGDVSSAWARLEVAGEVAAAPSGVRCQPVAAAQVRLRWDSGPDTVMAYTVLTNKIGGKSLPRQPTTNTEEVVLLEEPLTHYAFQVRTYIRTANNKTMVSELSEAVICQGQGVPLKLVRVPAGVLVSWGQFAASVGGVGGAGGVRQWVLQTRADNSSLERNVTLPADVTNYTLPVSEERGVQVRVLGTRALPWLRQELALVPWTSTSAATLQLHSGGVAAAPTDVEVTSVGSTNFTVRWRHEEASLAPGNYSYMLCTRKLDGNEKCIATRSRQALVSGLSPGGEYSVRVQARAPHRQRASDFTDPLLVTTQPDGVELIKELTYKMMNTSCVLVSWDSPPGKYSVYYSYDMNTPTNQWPAVDVHGNTVPLCELDLTQELFVKVAAHEPVGYSRLLTVPVQIRESSVRYSVSGGALHVWWSRGGARVLRYSHNITQPLHTWTARNVTAHHYTITDLDLSKPTYVIVESPGVNQRGQVLTIQPQPPHDNSLYYVAGGACVSCALAAAAAAACVLRRRKRARAPPRRSRRRNTSPGDGGDGGDGGEGSEEEGAEMKALSTRLANGGGKDARACAGEPLLNGHVHITENPTSKTSNGKLRKGRRYEAPLDLSRQWSESPPCPPSPPPVCVLLDTSRGGELAEPAELAALADKLPDDNMNSQVRRGSAPTLQPNG